MTRSKARKHSAAAGALIARAATTTESPAQAQQIASLVDVVSLLGGLPARVGDTSLRRSFVLFIPVARGANWFLAGGGRRMDEEEATAAAAERIAAAAEDGTSLPVRLATDVVRFLYGGAGRREPADGGVVSASLLNAKPAVGGIGVEPRGAVYNHLWYNNGRWYAVLPPARMEEAMEIGLTAATSIAKLPIADLAALTVRLDLHYLPGNTLIYDFPFMAYPDHLGHWLELAVPTWNMLMQEAGEWAEQTTAKARRIHNVLFPNAQKRSPGWMGDVITVVLWPGHNRAGPEPEPNRIDYYDIGAVDQKSWLLFENVVVSQDRYTEPMNRAGFRGPEHGDLWRYDGCDRWISSTFASTFATPQLGRTFREYTFLKYATELASENVTAPKSLSECKFFTLLTLDGGPKIVNNREMYDTVLKPMAETFGLEARHIVMNEADWFKHHLSVAATSAVIVGRQSPLMANTIFLTPGAMVLEILPYKWEWHRLSMLYYNLTQSIGDVHHFAWRAMDVSAAVYHRKEGAIAEPIRYKDWKSDECHARECLDPQGSADVIVDLPAIEAILQAKLPGVFAGKSVEELAELWPAPE
ncbi:hypothetical protein FOA52_013629 [Chlamydomonas sp. UWO 241]|nr:hypothetical protein FOA52_013629 [Chlamydomonas sp. UWO 241]